MWDQTAGSRPDGSGRAVARTMVGVSRCWQSDSDAGEDVSVCVVDQRSRRRHRFKRLGARTIGRNPSRVRRARMRRRSRTASACRHWVRVILDKRFRVGSFI